MTRAPGWPSWPWPRRWAPVVEATSPPLAPPWLQPGLIERAGWLLASHRSAYGRPLIVAAGPPAQELFVASVVVLAHDGDVHDPLLTYANAAALRLWRRSWAQMVGMPSRLTAEPAERPERARLLASAWRQEAISGYHGIRIDSSGRRFAISGARLWTLRDPDGHPRGQAAAFARWWWLA